jgi:hypothetical protein
MTKIILILSLMIFVLSTSNGQKMEVYVLTKSEEKNAPSKSIKRVELNTERTDIIIRTWKQEKIKLEIEYVSKHALKTTAEKELNYLNMLADQSGSTFYIKSVIKLASNGKPPHSALSFRLILTIPENIPLLIKNKLGRIEIENISMPSIHLDLDLCHLLITNSKLKGKILQKFGECQLNNTRFEGSMHLIRTLTRLEFITGDLSIKSVSGRIHIVPDKESLNMVLSADKTEVELMGEHINKHYINVKGDRTIIDLSDKSNSQISSNSASLGVKNVSGGIDIQNVMGSVRIYSY